MITKFCENCHREYVCKKYLENKRKYCSFGCYYPHRLGISPWNKGVHGWKKIDLKGEYIICEFCGKNKYFEPNQLKKRPCKHCSIFCARRASRKKVLVYSSIHARIKRDWGKAVKCEYCGSERNVDWANMNGKYDLDRNSWSTLCRSCHLRHDRKNLKGAYLLFINK